MPPTAAPTMAPSGPPTAPPITAPTVPPDAAPTPVPTGWEPGSPVIRSGLESWISCSRAAVPGVTPCARFSSSLMQCLLYVDGQVPGTPRCFGGTYEQLHWRYLQ